MNSLHLSRHERLDYIFFSSDDGFTNVISTINEFLSNHDVSTAIETTNYPFSVNTPINIPLSDKYAAFFFKYKESLSLPSEDPFTIVFDSGPSPFPFSIKYGKEILNIKKGISVTLDFSSSKSPLFIFIDSYIFENTQPSAISNYTFSEVDSHMDKIISGGKSKSKNKSNNQSAAPKR